MNDSLRADLSTGDDEALTASDHTATAPLRFDKPIILVGMMGAGKTTIGRALARAVGRDFVDLDLALEARCGVRVAVIFEIEGEEGFRRREAQMLEHYSAQTGIVLATGGGAVLDAGNRRFLKERGVVVYLRASAHDLYQRVARDRHRPLLQTEDPLGRLTELLAEREPLYDEVASITFDTGDMSIMQSVRTLISLLQQSETP